MTIPLRARLALSALKGRLEVLAWRRRGSPLPPPDVFKRATVRAYRKAYGPRVLVETGTFRGDMMFVQQFRFDRLYSIELDPILFQKAAGRFRESPHIRILQGDSGRVLPGLIREIGAPCLFWLDGHYSGGETARGVSDTPVVKELEAILSDPRDHVILIDDARLFTGKDGYPTLEEIRNLVLNRRKDYSVTMEDDIIRIVKQR